MTRAQVLQLLRSRFADAAPLLARVGRAIRASRPSSVFRSRRAWRRSTSASSGCRSTAGSRTGPAPATGRAVVYQDATAQELVIAIRGASGWTHTKIAGSDTPYKGAYGFFASCALTGGDVVMSTFALNQTTYEMWVELFRQKMN